MPNKGRKAKLSSSTAWPEVAIDKLATSGLTQAQAEKLGIQCILDASELSQSYPKMPALVFSYWDPKSGSYVNLDDFHRVRLLGEHPDPWVRVQKQQPRYLQPKDTLNRVYLPTQGGGGAIDWQRIYSDPATPLLITEGELKAACCSYMIASPQAVGLGGVTMWSARQRGVDELPFFKDVNWKGRVVYICFDTDQQGGLKEQVAKAAQALMDHLLNKGAKPQLVTLPWEGSKMGLDDFLTTHNLAEFDEVLQQSVGHSSAKELMSLNGKFYWCEGLGAVIKADTGEMVRRDAFLTSYQNRTVFRMVKKAVGQPKRPGLALEGMPLGKAFLDWEARPTVDGILYEPGKDTIVHNSFNMWRGYPVEPEEGDISEFLWVLDNVFGDDPAAREFIEHWFFYPLLHPGAKLYTICLIHSPLEGIGKTFPAEMMARYVYGLDGRYQNSVILQEGDIAGDYNSFITNKQLVIGDDVAGTDAYHHLARIKALVTNEHIVCKKKYVPEYTVRNTANFYLTSNQVVPFKISDDDRRFFVHKPTRAVKDHERYIRVRQWFEAGGGAKVLWYALNTYDSKEFTPSTRAPQTVSRSQMIELGRTSIEQWVYDRVIESETLPDVITPDQLHDMYVFDHGGSTNVTTNAIGRVLSKAGLHQWRAGQKLRVKDRIVRPWVIRNPEKWNQAAPQDVSNEITRIVSADGKVVPIDVAKKNGSKY